MTPTPPTDGQLSDLGDAVGLIAAIRSDLEAGELVAELAPDPTSCHPSAGTAAGCTRVWISTPHVEVARDLANVLQLAPWPNATDVVGWEGLYPLTEGAARPLRVELAITGDEAAPLITLQEILSFLDLVTFAVSHDTPVTRVRVRAVGIDGGEAEIYTTAARGGEALWDELADVALPLRPIVLTPDLRPITHSPRDLP